jgi:RimJ/RimL family protein N-acetyltransferase
LQGALIMTLLEPTDARAIGPEPTEMLRTERLVLRPPRPSDAPAIAELANDRRIAENLLRIPHPYSLEDARAFLAMVERASE